MNDKEKAKKAAERAIDKAIIKKGREQKVKIRNAVTASWAKHENKKRGK